MRRLWLAIDRFGRIGAPRASWIAELGDGFAEWSGLLRPCDTVDSIEDPDFPGHILDLEGADDGRFLGYSREVPSHRPPMLLERAMCVRLVPDLRALAGLLALKLGFEAAPSPRWSGSGFHEIGWLPSEKENPRPVHLFIPDARCRQAALKAGVCGIPRSIALLPSPIGYTSDIAALAGHHEIQVRVLSTQTGLTKLSISPPRGSVPGRRKTKRAPLLTPKAGWQWKHLILSIERDGLRFRIHGEEAFQTWAELRMRPVSTRHPNKILDILGRLANGERITQRRADVNARQQVSVARQFLKDLIPNMPGNPFHNFIDGWGVEFQVDGAVGRKQVAEWENGDVHEEIRLDSPRAQFDRYEGNFRTFQT